MKLAPAFSKALSGQTAYQHLTLYLIKPSKYDDDGYIVRFWKGVLPSNTLACLNGLSEDVRKRGVLGRGLKWKIEAIDETVERVDIQKIIRESRRKKTKTIVCLVGVQSNQFPRAADLALSFRKAGIDVLIGGFHVSGILATLPYLTPELALLQEAGVTLVAGEVEGRWESLLRDALTGNLKPVYNFLLEPPDLSRAPMPEIPKNLLGKFAVRRFATLDCGRGCPFQCSFCTVINVQGRRMRFRPVEGILRWLRENYRRHKINYYFFTDDNFSRNKNWEAIFDALTRLREEEKIDIGFMMQVDTQSHKIKNFTSRAGRAGCKQVFIGMESLNEENLKAAGKKQNRVGEYNEMIEAYHRETIATHLAYIIGFPFDSKTSVQNDMARLRNELGAEQASFFMLTPLPGSVDYRNSLSQGEILDHDLNNFDSFHETFRHSQLKPREWTQLYDRAWRNFYRTKNMKNILRRVAPSKYWPVFLNFIWYKNSIQVEGGHPMINGFLRLKGRLSRRSTFPVESRWCYFRRRARDLWGTLTGWAKLAFEMEEVWLATRRRSPLEERVLLEIDRLQKRAEEWRSLRLAELQTLYRRAAWSLEKSQNRWAPQGIQIPSQLQLWFKKWDFFSDSLTRTRVAMSHFWRDAARRLRQGRIHQVRLHQVVLMSLREGALLSRFLLTVLKVVLFPTSRA